MSRGRGLGVFTLIRSREDAKRVARGAALAFYGVAIALAVTAWYRGWQDLVDAGLYVVLASLMWRYHSPAAGFTLLLIAVMRFFITVGVILETGQVVWTYIAVTLVVVFASIRAIEATLKLNGRYALQGP
ncbi:MAG TPA: hypothetical protein VHA15_04135 [Burkholderiales bacterium]|nr:hypothetical protein [Burkholderiales bacterium]